MSPARRRESLNLNDKFNMFWSKKKCIVCGMEMAKGAEIKKHATYFCSEDCVKKYEEMLIEAKKKVNLDDCC